MRWKNDAGWTSEILRVPDQDAWDWRLSIAEVEADSAFSAFPGVDRWLMLLSGEGMQLCFQDGVTQTLRPPHGAAQFSGDRALTGRLVSGPSSDFNVMWRRDRMAAQTWHRPLVGSMVVFAEPGETWAIHLLAGQARFAKEHGLESGLNGELDDALDGELDGLQPGDTAVLQAAEIRQRYALDGAGEVLLIRMTRLGSGPQA
jgi:hypothetical protein